MMDNLFQSKKISELTLADLAELRQILARQEFERATELALNAVRLYLRGCVVNAVNDELTFVTRELSEYSNGALKSVNVHVEIVGEGLSKILDDLPFEYGALSEVDIPKFYAETGLKMRVYREIDTRPDGVSEYGDICISVPISVDPPSLFDTSNSIINFS